MKNQKVQCRLCEQYFNDEDMSEEHYPAHCVGNDDIIALDFIKYMDTCMGNNQELYEDINNAIRNGVDPKVCADKYFDQYLAKDLYPKGRTARTYVVSVIHFLENMMKLIRNSIWRMAIQRR